MVHLGNIVELVVPDRGVRIIVLALQDLHELHFDVVADTVSYGAFGARRDDEPILDLRGALFDRADDVLPGIPRKPFVDGVDFGSKALKLIDGHRSHLKQGIRHKVLDALFGRCELYLTRSVASGVRSRTQRQELEQRSPCPCYGGPKRSENLLGLRHGRCHCDLVRGLGIDDQMIRLNRFLVQGLGVGSGDDEKLLVGETLLDLFADVGSARAIGVGNVDIALDEIPPPIDLFGPQFEGVEQVEFGSIGQSEFVLAEFHITVDGVIVVVDVRIRDEPIDAVHLHGDGLAYRNDAAHDLITELTIVFRNGGVG